MANKVILITGALTGQDERWQATGKFEIRALGAEAEFIYADVRKEDDAVERFGRLDVAVNNAGTEGTPGPIRSTFDTNVLGTVLSLKHELRVMTTQGSGSIITTSSTFGHKSFAGASIYVASKHAIEGLTLSVALEAAASGTDPDRYARPLRWWKRGEKGRIGVNCASQTRWYRGGGRQHCLFVASDSASFIIGSVLSVDGGVSSP
ncbi:hypothetical protein V1525DRAFT_411210 [Lipomyces kononenkoae]|uniref:Uncharacterized protein n=1 Tax=Lipomyces kononenkoae TaxID=34357 RepID=A0ACC3SV73_LIPKO